MNPKHRQRHGFSLIELMIVIAIILIIAVVAMPPMQRAKMHAHEMAAVKTIQTIHTAQVQYETQFGRFASSLDELGPPEGGQPGPQAADLVDSDLAAGEKSGYRFTVTANQSGYAVSAVPVAYNVTGTCTFYSDQTTRIRQNNGPQPATIQSPLLRH